MGNYLASDYNLQVEYLNFQLKLEKLEKQNKTLEQKYKNIIYSLDKKNLLDNKMKDIDKRIDELDKKIENLYDYVEKVMKNYYKKD